MIRQIIIIALFLIVIIPTVTAETVVVNSDDWMDVYSGLQYAYLKGDDALFMTGKRYSALLPKLIGKNEDVLVIESQKIPFTINLAGALRVQGYNAETLYSSGGRATNIELAKLSDTDKFIIIDPSYGFNAISVAGYAQHTNAYVIFADGKNIDQVLTFLNSKDRIESMLLYGQLNTRLVESLAIFSPEIIDEGNRYKDNLALLKKHISIKNVRQLLITDGSFIEKEMFLGGKSQKEATLLLGTGRIPDEVIEFVNNNNIDTAVVIGTHLSSTGSRFKQATGIPVFVKFGMGIAVGTPSEPVNALDLFALPVINLDLALVGAQYNTFTKKIEITYKNRGIRVFARTSAGILADTVREITIGDQDSYRIEPNATVSFQYDADLTELIAEGRKLELDLFTPYGESIDSLDKAIVATIPLETVEVEDDCELEAKSIGYNTRTQRFMLELENSGPVTCYANIELRDVIINDATTTITLPEVVPIRQGTKTIDIKQRMTDVDIADNPEINVRTRYGERSDYLLQLFDARLPLEAYKDAGGLPENVLMLGVISILVLIIIIMFFVMRKKSKKK